MDAKGPNHREFTAASWGVIAATAMTLTLSSGALSASSSVFLVTFLKEFGWSNTQYSALFMVSTYACALAGFGLARAADRFGSHKVIIPTAVFFAVALMAMSQLNGDWPQAAALFGLSGAGAATAVCYFRLNALWFHGRLGMALSIGAVASGLLSAAYGPIVNSLGEQLGWRNTYLALGGLYAAIALPLQWIFARDPADAVHRKASDVARAPLTGESLKSALRTPELWLIFFIDLFAMMIPSGLRLHIVPLFGERGMSPTVAIATFATASIGALAVRPFFGWALDRFNTPRSVLPFALLTVFGMLGVAFGASALLLLPALFLVCAGAATEAGSGQYFVVRYFGRLNYGQIISVIYLATPLGIGLGPLALGYLRDQTGNHMAGVMLLTGLTVACVLLLAAMPRYRYSAENVATAPAPATPPTEVAAATAPQRP